MSGDSRNYGPNIKDVVDERRREFAMETLNKRCLTLGFHNRVLQVLPPLWEFLKITVKHLIKNGYIGNQR